MSEVAYLATTYRVHVVGIFHWGFLAFDEAGMVRVSKMLYTFRIFVLEIRVKIGPVKNDYFLPSS